MRNIIIASAVFLALVALGSWYYFFDRPAAAELDLGIDHPDEVLVGEPFVASVTFSNTSDRVLGDAEVSLALPAGVAALGDDESVNIIRRPFGDVGPGSVSREDFNLIVLADPNSLKELEARVQYGITNNPKARYEAKKTSVLRIGNRALPISFSAPERTVSGELFSVKVAYRNESETDYDDLRLRISYPPNFQFVKAEPEPDRGKGEWDVPVLRREENGEIEIQGSMAGPEQSVANFEAALAGQFRGEEYVIARETASISIAPSPLALAAHVNNKDGYVARIDDALSYIIRYKNNAAMPLQNVTITAALTGELYDFLSLTSSGALNSVTNTITWNAGNVPELAFVDGGKEGSVAFYLKTKNQYPIARLGDKNYVLRVDARAESPTVSAGSAAKKTISLAQLETKVQGKVELAARAYFRDAASGIVNEGPYPPRVNQTTEYTLHWIVKNFATNVSGAKVRAFLQSGARATGVVKSNVETKPVYNPSSGEIVWDIGSIAATKGVVSAPLEAVIQIEHTPAVNQVGQTVTLAGESHIEATDDFTGVILSETAREMQSDLPDDTSIATTDRAIQL